MDSLILHRVFIRSWENISYLLVGFVLCWLYMKFRKRLAIRLHVWHIKRDLKRFDKLLDRIEKEQNQK